jgi:hypothetical protein
VSAQIFPDFQEAQFPGGRAQFFIVETGMDNELGHSGFQVSQRCNVKLGPFFRCNFGFNRDRMV